MKKPFILALIFYYLLRHKALELAAECVGSAIGLGEPSNRYVMLEVNVDILSSHTALSVSVI